MDSRDALWGEVTVERATLRLACTTAVRESVPALTSSPNSKPRETLSGALSAAAGMITASVAAGFRSRRKTLIPRPNHHERLPEDSAAAVFGSMLDFSSVFGRSVSATLLFPVSSDGSCIACNWSSMR